jgi:dolichol kinase
MRGDLEFKRQSVHLLVGLSEAYLVWLLKPVIGLYIFIPLAVTLLFLYYAPRIAPNAPVVSHLLFHFERKEDLSSFPFKGAFMFNVGIVFPIVFLDTQTACAAIAVLALGDSFSTIVGKSYGRHRIGVKSLEGFLAFVAAAYVGALLFVDQQTALTFAFIGGLVELLININDNLTIPVSLTLASILLGL